MHTTSGRWQLGLFLSLLTAVLWGLLPIALKGLLQYTDAITITWFRFFIAASVLGLFLWKKNRLPSLSLLKNKHIAWLTFIVIAGLLGNYVLYMMGLNFVTPGGAQVMIQTAPMLLLIGGLVLFKESFHFKQWLGLMTFLAGLILFFNQRFDQLLDPSDDYTFGLILIFIAGVTWAAYALAQKQLLKSYKSDEIMIMIYVVGSIVFIPVTEFNMVIELDTLGWLLLLFCGANTLVAYGAFAEALDHWEASRVSATLALTPLLTLLFMYLFSLGFPDFVQPEPVNELSIFGALLVVVGSSITALSKNKARKIEGADGLVHVDEGVPKIK
ncbi:MAG: DMT family transporter [Gammaproteobacteria bacterium]|nr:DMT family transporter [Gammaproteobacteria bacterium]